MSKPAIGFCGLGAMGLGMATHLVKQGYNVTGFDVYPPSLEKFQKAGGTPSTSLSESAKDKPFYIVMVASAIQAQPALFADDGIVKALPKGATLLLTSTVPSSYAQSVEKELKDIGRDDIYFIDAPVSGGAGRAADGTLSIMAGASDAAFEKGKWLLAEMSAPSKLFIVEGGVGQGSNMKMVHQVLAAIQILAVSEAYGFGARLGLNGKDVSEAIIGSDAWSWMFENRTQRTLKEDYFPGASAVTIILKDTVSLRLAFLMVLVELTANTEYHHTHGAPTSVSHSTLLDRRASLLCSSRSWLGCQRRCRNRASLDRRPSVKHSEFSFG
jgi:3-hydroxyisobutyrate dehydrogenase